MSKWEKTNLWLKQHYLCVIVWLVVVLIALIVVMAGNDKELVGYFSFACSLSGILLAIVVIIHTWIDSADTRTVLTEVKSHLTDIRGDVGRTFSAVDRLREEQNILSMDLTSRFVRTDAEHEIRDSQTDSFPFRLSELSAFNLCAYYCAVKSFREDRAFVASDVIKNMLAQEKEALLVYYTYSFLGALVTLKGLIGFKQIRATFSEKTIVKDIPSELCDSVEYQLNQRIEDASLEQKATLVAWKQGIDDYFTAS